MKNKSKLIIALVVVCALCIFLKPLITKLRFGSYSKNSLSSEQINRMGSFALQEINSKGSDSKKDSLNYEFKKYILSNRSRAQKFFDIRMNLMSNMNGYEIAQYVFLLSDLNSSRQFQNLFSTLTTSIQQNSVNLISSLESLPEDTYASDELASGLVHLSSILQVDKVRVTNYLSKLLIYKSVHPATIEVILITLKDLKCDPILIANNLNELIKHLRNDEKKSQFLRERVEVIFPELSYLYNG